MTVPTDTFAAWLAQAHLRETRLSAEQLALLQAAFRFRQRTTYSADRFSPSSGRKRVARPDTTRTDPRTTNPG